MYEEAQFDLLRAWVLAGTELPDCIQAFQDAPRPTTDYAMLNLTRSRKLPNQSHQLIFEANSDYDGTETGPAEFWETYAVEMEFTWTLHVYAKRPINVLNRLIPWKMHQVGRELLGGLNLFRLGDATRIPEQDGQHWIERGVTELTVRTWVCNLTEVYGNETILIGRVPVDLVEQVTVMIPGFDITI